MVIRLSFLKVFEAAALMAAISSLEDLDNFNSPDSYASNISFSSQSSFTAFLPVLLKKPLWPFCLELSFLKKWNLSRDDLINVDVPVG